MKNLGPVIKQIRLKKGISQLHLAEKINVTQGFISQIEKGVRNPTLEILTTIANILQVPVSMIMYMEESRNKDFLISEQTEYKEFFQLLFKNYDFIAETLLNTAESDINNHDEFKLNLLKEKTSNLFTDLEEFRKESNLIKMEKLIFLRKKLDEQIFSNNEGKVSLC